MSWLKRAWTAIGVIFRLSDPDPYLRIRELEDEVDGERRRRRGLEEEVQRLDERLERSDRIEHDGNICWRLDEDGTREHPICARCYNADNVTIPLTDAEVGVFHCPNCEKAFRHEAASDERPTRSERRRIVDEGL